ncbi:hypothetical protein [Xanthomonas cannabis]
MSNKLSGTIVLDSLFFTAGVAGRFGCRCIAALEMIAGLICLVAR